MGPVYEKACLASYMQVLGLEKMQVLLVDEASDNIYGVHLRSFFSPIISLLT